VYGESLARNGVIHYVRHAVRPNRVRATDATRRNLKGRSSLADAPLPSVSEEGDRDREDMHPEVYRTMKTNPRSALIFSLNGSTVSVSWPGRPGSVELGDCETVAYMMRDFLAQCELGERLARRTVGAADVPKRDD
jgi:hypothetical protein